MNFRKIKNLTILIIVILLTSLTNRDLLFSQTLSNYLSWDANSEQNITEYKIYRSTTSGTYDQNNPLGTVPFGTISYVDSTIQSDITYYYVITAKSSIGESSYSNEVSIKKTISGGSGSTLPVLSNGAVLPTTGTNTTQFTYTVHYTDNGGSTPKSSIINIDGQTHVMTLTSGSPNNGDYSFTINTLTNGNHNFFFNFVDNSSNLVRTPTGTATLPGPTVGTTGKPDKPKNVRYINK